MLVGFGGNHAGVVAAVLVYRFLTIVPTLVFGAVAAATWQRQRRAQAWPSALAAQGLRCSRPASSGRPNTSMKRAHGPYLAGSVPSRISTP